MAADRQPKMRAMIMAETEEERRAALDELLPHQQEDFEGLFKEMEGLPITIRLLDPPLHEFMPQAEEVAQDVERARIEQTDNLEDLEHTLDRIHSLAETNPMLGTRGVRLGVLHPEIYEMQIRAIFRAALAIAEPPRLEIMIPLVAYERELELMRGLVERVAGEEDASRPRLLGGHDDRAAARLLRGRPDLPRTPTSSPSAQTTSPRPRWASRATTWRAASSTATWRPRSSTAARSRRSIAQAWAGSCGWLRGPAARPSPT